MRNRPLLQTEKALAIAMWDFLWRGLRGLGSRLGEGSRKKPNKMGGVEFGLLKPNARRTSPSLRIRTPWRNFLKARSLR